METFEKISRQEGPHNVGKGRYYINPTYTKKDRNLERKRKSKKDKEAEKAYKRRAISCKPMQQKASRATHSAHDSP